ncbi:sensor histidine kinase [Rhodobacter capsulatus]|uniref:histidine kinase n=1 Tax=Rhodobacter capsulatus TaxID=1061 RepID=A0A1G7CB45_RHOCA|nr:sensor histidine kinase [Rhodobacter capsulatus]WER08895.1 sensor histidine kinase [Rhodobacter capsulatus]SDE35926.1 Signal transduction histidine kinase [Rhodobacter capsulatus]
MTAAAQEQAGGKHPGNAAVPLKAWLWRSYVKAALIPLLLIEFGFVAIYWATSQVVYDRSAAAITRISTDTVRDAALREANIIAHRLDTITAMTRIYAEEAGRALQTPALVSQAEKDNHALSPDGAFHSLRDTGGSAVFYSGIVPVGEAERDKVWRTVRLDPLMRSIKASDPLIAQLYLNTHDSLNRIYPWFDVLKIYPPKMDIPSYNFYYEADAAHDPEREPVWTDAYVDPAGGGWMVSSIAPVYSPARLEGVVGIDVTIGTIVQRVLDIRIPGDGYAVLVGREGTILALPPKGEADLGLSELLAHSYEEAILKDRFKPAEFNILQKPMLTELAGAMRAAPEGVRRIDLGRPMIASWAQVAGPDWSLLVLASEDSVLAASSDLRSQLAFVSKGMVGILLVFYAGFFAFLWRRSAAMSARVAEPLGDLERRMAVISDGGTLPPAPPSAIEELQKVGEHLVRMGDKIDAANRAKANFLSAMSHELRTPLNAIIGHADLLEGCEGERLEGARLEQLRAITAAGWDLVRLVDVVLDLSRIERQDLALSNEPLALRPLLEEALESHRAEAEKRAITLDLAWPEGPLPPLRGDAKILRRILDELLSNAVKYNLPGGRVTLQVAPEAAGFLPLRIIDTGVGIGAEHRDSVFKAFHRLGHENSTISGAGIGLAIAKRFAEISGCGLDFDSKAGAGSTFTLSLPCRPQ